MQDHRAAGLGGGSCSGERRQLCPCATAPKGLPLEERVWKRGTTVQVWGGGEQREGLPHRDVAAGSRAGARGLPRGPVGIQQRLLLHPPEVPLRGMEANPKVKGHIGQAGCDESYSPPEERVMSKGQPLASSALAMYLAGGRGWWREGCVRGYWGLPMGWPYLALRGLQW